jgi:hypothetical protein
VWQQGLCRNTKKWWQHAQLPHSMYRCYKVQPLLLRELFVAIEYIATKNVIAKNHFYNAFDLVPLDNITTPLIN